MPVENSAIDPTLRDHSPEKLLNEIGSHLMVYEGERPSLYAQDEAATMTLEEQDEIFDPWMPPSRELPEGFGDNQGPDEDRSAHVDMTIGNFTINLQCPAHADII